jgi:Protein of unknown function (DUF2785)
MRLGVIVKYGLILAAVALVLASASAAAQSSLASPGLAGGGHDREFWRAIVKNRFAVPEGQPVFSLLRELSGYLGSRDPELRDDLAYTITAVWVKHQESLSPEQLNLLVDEWTANLRVGIGEAGTDSVLKRSFSALCLSEIAKRELNTPFLTEERYRALLAGALGYLRDERDLRGFDPTLGWIHAAAHTADLLGALARNPFFRKEDQGRVLEAISLRLSSAHEIFTYGEQDRLALGAARIVLRKDFDVAGFERWLAATDEADLRVWKDSPPKLELLQTFENDSYMLRSLAVYVCTGPPDPALAEAQNALLKVLRER